MYWMPKCEEIRFKHCADPPAKLDLVEILLEVLDTNQTDDPKFDTMFKNTCE